MPSTFERLKGIIFGNSAPFLDESPAKAPEFDRPMRMVLCGLNFSPELTGIGKYSGELVEWLSARGHEITVITAPPYYPEWEIGRGYSATPHFKLWYSVEQHGTVRVIRCPIWVPKQATGLKRIIHLMSFAVSSLPALLTTLWARPDLYFAVAPAFFSAPMTWLTARLARVKCWLHIQDFELDVAFELGLIKGNTLRAWVEKFEKWVLQGFDRVSTISPNMVERLWQKGVSPMQTVLFRNWVDVENIYPLEGRNSFRRELDIPDDALVALYSGNMGRKQGLEILAQAAARLDRLTTATTKAPAKQLLPTGDATQEEEVSTEAETVEPMASMPIPPIVFVFCGEGVGRKDLMDLCQGCSNVRFLKLQPLVRLNELLNLADIHLLPQRAGAADLVMPSKLGGMLASGKPVIATTDRGTQIAELLQACGVITPPEETESFMSAILKLAIDSAQRKKLGIAGRQISEEQFSRNTIITQLLKDLKEILCNSPNTANPINNNIKREFE